MGRIPFLGGCCLLCKELLIRLNGTILTTENGSVRHLHITEKILDLSDRFHPLVSHFAVQGGQLGSIALDDQDPFAYRAYRSTNNLHNNLRGNTMVRN